MTKSKLVSVVFGAFAALLLLAGVAEAYDSVSPDVEVATGDAAIGRRVCKILQNGRTLCYWRRAFQEVEGIDQAALDPENGEEVAPTETEEEFTFEAEEADQVVAEEDGAATEPMYFIRPRFPKIKVKMNTLRSIAKKVAPRL